PCCPRDLRSVPTRRSSDLPEGPSVLELVRRERELEPRAAEHAVQAPVPPDDLRFAHERPEELPAAGAERAPHLEDVREVRREAEDRKSTRLNSSHVKISYA